VNRVWQQCCEKARTSEERHHRRQEKIAIDGCFVGHGLCWRWKVKESMGHHEDLVLSEASPISLALAKACSSSSPPITESQQRSRSTHTVLLSRKEMKIVPFFLSTLAPSEKGYGMAHK